MAALPLAKTGLTVLLALLLLAEPALPARAEQRLWQRGFILWSPHAGYPTPEVLQSIRALRGVGASHVALLVTWYVDNPGASEIHRRPDTPTDVELQAAAQEARRLGLEIVLVLHVNCQDGSWRATIEPNDTDRWFDQYASIVDHYAAMAERWGAAGMMVGAELIKLSAPPHTQRWRRIIGIARSRFHGFLTYSANWGSNAPPGQPDPLEEFSSIEFWPELDYIGIAAYFELHEGGGAGRGNQMASWQDWKRRKLEPLHERYGKPILFTEIGYRSARGAAVHPWDYGDDDPDPKLQADLYSALLDYWRNEPWLAGIYFWHWPVDSVSEASDYSPLGKLAENVVRYWFRFLARP